MKNLFEVYIEQTYTSYEKWFGKRFNEQQNIVEGCDTIILAKDEEEAIKKYKLKSKTDYNFPLDSCRFIDRYENVVNTVKARLTMNTFDYLKEHMRADEFIEYCRQQFYSIEALLK